MAAVGESTTAMTRNPHQTRHEGLQMKTLKAPPLTTILHQHLLECTDPQRTLHAIDKEVRGSSLSESYIGADPLELLQTVERVLDACVPDLRIDYSALTRTAEGI
jgi:hypothetical protein